ncbi:hypothetical protein HN51_003699 [Arachis hypogaea]|uniref:Fe2OG dioxygenase domain-containing protein n=1 Tax=Arachis hypogaea TaxID=3818 RepID=A0A445DJX8_ARAHY|nr:gibberellin 2-beta-dioxygenase 8 [Arachis hypogaea]QHO37220.1 Gibberellin 2-beta-dioxygenase [Arachis hypogaea]RYR63511.1 hypothetical protein Ahy_A04g021327 [Arachis hypogaea]
MNNLESYPPILRNYCHHYHHHHHDSNIDDVAQDYSDPVPVIDLELLEEEKERFEDACKDWGLFRLVNHGIPLTLLKQLQEEAKEVFSMSYETKHATCSESPITYFWGTPALTPTGTALCRGPKNFNWVEGLDVPLGQLSKFQPQLPKLDSIRLLLMEYETHLSRIATTIFKVMMKNLDLNNNNMMMKQTECCSYVSRETGMVRMYRYPACSDTSIGWGMEVHTDSSVLSILNQDDQVSGLQVLKDDQWLTVKPISNTLIVNLGDMMQAMSNDKYKSVQHRVRVNKERERISICYFVFPSEGAVIESPNYKPFTYNEFREQVQQDVKALGYKVGLPRFKHSC